MAATTLGPDLVIAGAARSGTSSLAAQLSTHPGIDLGKVKESNYFSRELARGPDWYDSLYADRRDGRLRLDASTSYTSALYPESLGRLAKSAPDALVIYIVRHPTQRALSHYLYRHHYFHLEDAPNFGAALRATSYYVEGSDYSRWIPELRDAFSDQRLLVVPFEVVTEDPHAVTTEICRQLGLAPPADARDRGRQHRNDVVEYRNAAARHASKLLRRSSIYPRVRGAVGSCRMRNARGLLTREARLPGTEEAMASCDAEQLASLRRLDERAGAVTLKHLVAQDERLELAWAGQSFASPGGRSDIP
ncbi:MAG: sulfotransferase family protein [Nocardioidaceae bacterium]